MILLYFILLLFIVIKYKSIVTFFLAIQIVSILGAFFINLNYDIDSFSVFLNEILTLFLLSLIFLPWINYNKITTIVIVNELKLKRITYFLIIISVIPFVIFSLTSIFVFTLIEDINEFKYIEDVSTDFYYNLPLNIKAIIFSNYIHVLSIFLIPLHFYYLSIKRYKLAFVCFLFSLNIILFGLTYFSRSVFIHYVFIYISFLILMFGTLSHKTQGFIKKSLIVVLISIVIYFIDVSTKRFSAETNNYYTDKIPVTSFIQDPNLYSNFDYLSQWYPNNMILLQNYKFETFNGQTSLQPLLTLLSEYNLTSYKQQDYNNFRKKLWPEHYYKFNGLVAYSIYDYGYFFSFILFLLYYWVVIQIRPRLGRVNLYNLFYIVLLIQIPVLAIFYSAVGAIVMPALLFIPIYFYLKISFKKN